MLVTPASQNIDGDPKIFRKGGTAVNTVLFCVIEDETSLAEILRESLESIGQTVAFHTPNAAIEAFSNGLNPVASLIDLNLPEMNGLELIAKCRQESWAGKIVLISGCMHRRDIMQALNLGVHACLEKPFNPEDMLNIFRELAFRENRRPQKNIDLMNFELGKIYLESFEILKTAVLSATTGSAVGKIDRRQVLDLIVREQALLNHSVARGRRDQ